MNKGVVGFVVANSYHVNTLCKSELIESEVLSDSPDSLKQTVIPHKKASCPPVFSLSLGSG
jgi:hypothetical protein